MPFQIPNREDADYPSQAIPDSGDFGIFAAGIGNFGVRSGCAVTAQGSPDMTVHVALGVAAFDTLDVPIVAANVTIAAADATRPRFDLIVAADTGSLSAVTGTPLLFPATAYPAIPADSVVLASVYVPATATEVSAGQIVDKRVIVPSHATITGAVDVIAANAQSKTSTTTFGNDAELIVPLLASTVVPFNATIYFSGTNAADAKIQWTLPAGATMIWYTTEAGDSTTSSAELTESSSKTLSFPGIATVEFVEVRGVVTVAGTAGNLTLQWAQNASNGTPTVRRAGSSIRYNSVTP